MRRMTIRQIWDGSNRSQKKKIPHVVCHKVNVYHQPEYGLTPIRLGKFRLCNLTDSNDYRSQPKQTCKPMLNWLWPLARASAFKSFVEDFNVNSIWQKMIFKSCKVVYATCSLDAFKALR